MIHVVASIRVKPGRIPEFLEIFKSNVPSVKAEEGCLEYAPTIDIDSGLPPQHIDGNRVTIIEKWESLAALHAHLGTPHMLAYREQVKDIVEDLSLAVLEDA